MPLYKYYQKIGGTEEWTPIQADQPLDTIKPTFLTVLDLDRQLEGGETPEEIQAVKYQGPMYFDFDHEDLAESILGAQELIAKLEEKDLAGTDMEIFLSGKKGLHVTIPPSVFMEKIVPIARLVPMYKELAFKVAVRTLDWRVYTARKGRMWRTSYNVRENGNYKVPITLAELKTLTPENYAELCKAPRIVSKPQPVFRPRFALMFEACKSKIAGMKVRKAKSVSPQVLAMHAPVVGKVLAGQGLKEDVGFNQIAMQVALYAKEKGWSLEEMLKACEGLIANHISDSYRYNSAKKRQEALRDMFYYMAEDAAYEYGIEPIKALLAGEGKRTQVVVSEEGEETEIEIVESDYGLTSGVFAVGNCYMFSRGEQGDQQITNFIFTKVVKVLDRVDGTIIGLTAMVEGDSSIMSSKVTMLPSNFTGSTSFHNLIAPFGGTFTGTDMHARGLYQIMLRTVSRTEYLVDSEGINLLSVPSHPDERLRTPFIAWADYKGVHVPAGLRDINFTFQGFPETEGVIKTDLTDAPSLSAWLTEDDNKALLKSFLLALFECHSPEIIGKTVGWMFACFYRPILHEIYNQFPLLHAYGPSGAGKTAFITALQHLFFYKNVPPITSPSSSPFGFETLISSSASVPVVLDEYKPGTMASAIVERYRAIFRDAYNMRTVTRGGGNAKKDNYNALNKKVMSGPIVFLAEAVEGETAINERVVLVSIRRYIPIVAMKTYAKFMHVEANTKVFSVLGHYTASRVASGTTVESVKEEFDALFEKAKLGHMLRPEDTEARIAGLMSEEEYLRREANKIRPMFNNTVSLFGLSKLRKICERVFEDDFAEVFEPHFEKMEAAIFTHSQTQKENTTPEYIKVMTAMSDMTRLDANSTYKLIDGIEFNIGEFGGKEVLIIAARAAYNKYRGYCRSVNKLPLYPDENSFAVSLRDIPQFVRSGNVTKNLRVETAILDLDQLNRAGVAAWTGKNTTPPHGTW